MHQFAVVVEKNVRVVIPFYSGKILHPKIVKQVLKAIASDES